MSVLQGLQSFPIGFPKSPQTDTQKVTITASNGLQKWLAGHRFSIAFNTYHIGKLFMLGVDALGHFNLSEANFKRSMGLGFHQGTLWMASEKQIWRLENFLKPGQQSHGHDAVFAPVGAKTTGMINLHDVRVSDEGVFFVASNFNCIGKLHDKWSFEPYWKPPFVSEFEYGDRCHLNCLALEYGLPKYVTAFSETDSVQGWRSQPDSLGTGVVIDVQTNDILCRGLHMPHSPQLHNGVLYVANSGCGEFGTIDRNSGQYTAICKVPGFTRGIAFWRHFAFVGSSKPRKAGVFEGNKDTPLNRHLAETNSQAQCQISIIDLRKGKIKHQLTIGGVASEIYDVCILPGVQRPFVTDVESEQMNTLFRPSKMAL